MPVFRRRRDETTSADAVSAVSNPSRDDDANDIVILSDLFGSPAAPEGVRSDAVASDTPPAPAAPTAQPAGDAPLPASVPASSHRVRYSAEADLTFDEILGFGPRRTSSVTPETPEPTAASHHPQDVPADAGHDTPTTTIGDNVAALEETINSLLAIDGATGAAVVDSNSGMALASGGQPGFDLDIAAAGNSNVVRAKLATMSEIGLASAIEDILITLDGQYHLINVLHGEGRDGLFVYLVLDSKRANLALARHKLKSIASGITI